MQFLPRADPTGTYYQYAFTFPNLNDYPKFGVWPDGYYMSANAFAHCFNHVELMLLYLIEIKCYQDCRLLCNILPYLPHTLLPSDCDGAAPPLGAPNYFLGTYNVNGLGNTDLDIYQFHVDWVHLPSTFTGPLFLATPALNHVPGVRRQDIPQLGTTAKLDALDDRPMNRLQYRNFGDHQAMVVCHSLDAGGGRAGIRWWELRKNSGNWSIYQEGTYAPADGLHRWMGSIAMDVNGIIALGYSTSSSAIYPDIRYTGRITSDPLGVMTFAETVIQAGGGSQTSSSSRWGDYTQMTVDPSVSGTFWYTNEYYLTTSSSDWRTRIAAFKFDIATLAIKVIPEGFYDTGLNRLNMKDTVRAYLRNVTSPYAKVDSAKAVIDSITFNGDFKFSSAATGIYYIALNHRNSIETWSKTGGEAIIKGATISYDFTDIQTKAYGNNMIQKGTKWCVFSGDVNQEGLVDGTDLAGVDNDNTNFATGYVATDLTGEQIVDGSDLALVDNNSAAFVSKVVPPGAIAVKGEKPFLGLIKEEIK